MSGFTRILNCIPSRDTERDWRLEHFEAAGTIKAPAALPSSKDLREDWWAIGNQRDTGSCVGWASADSVLRWHFVKAGRLESGQLLSPRFIWMAAKETDEFVNYPSTFLEIDGTSLKAALDIARKYGAVTDDVLPFASGGLFRGGVQEFFARAAQRKIAAYLNLGTDADKWRQWLAFNGPILTRLTVDTTWRSAPADGRLDRYDAGSAEGGHAVALVGYSPDGFVVRNSWGVEWGHAGFGYASTAYAAAAFTEAYGIVL